MKDISICPYCGGKMHLGFIHQQKFAIKWIPEEKNNWQSRTFSWLADGIVLTNELTGGNRSIESYYCNECEKIIIDTENKVNQNL